MDEDCSQNDRQLSRVAAIIGNVNSRKITDRRNFVNELLDIYDNNVFVEAINIQSTTNIKSSTSWNEIMLTVHQAAISEAERPVGKSGEGLAVRYSDLMRKTVLLATNTSNLFLSCNDLIACIFEILNEEIYKVHQETYCNILFNHVLTNKMYWLQITSEQWQEALRLSLKLYRGTSSEFKAVLLDTVRLIVQWGCRQSHLLLNVKKMLHFLEKIFQKIHVDNTTILKSLYKLTYTVCQQISTESRIALCEFSEKIIPSIICLETFPEKIDILLLLVQINYPGGLELENNAGHVRDPNLWRNIMTKIHDNILKDIKMKNPPPSFWKLCCEVYRQIIRNPSCLNEASSSIVDTQDEQPAKRQRLLIAARKPTDLLMNTDPDVAEPFIQILTALLKKYPDTLALTDYPIFLKTVMEFVVASLENEIIMDSLCKLCSVIIDIEKTHFYEAKEAENISSYWTKICEIILRTLCAHQNEIFGHKLLQSIIKNKNVLNTKEFICAYLKPQIRWSFSSVETLLMFSTYTPIPNTFWEPETYTATPNCTIRASLLHWALNIPMDKFSTEIPAVSLANLFTALAIKCSCTREFREFLNYQNRINKKKIAAAEAFKAELFDDRESKASSDIERCHLSLEFREEIMEFPEEPTNIDMRMSKILMQDIFDDLMSTLNTSLEISITEKNVSILITKVTVIAKLLSNFLELDSKFESQKSKLLQTFGEAYKRLLDYLISMEKSTSSYVVQAFEAIEMLYRTRFYYKISEIIIESTCAEFIVYIYDFLTDNDKDSENDENCEEINIRNVRTQSNTSILSDECRIINSSHQILTYFCCVQIGKEISPLQIRVLKNIMTSDIYETANSVDFRRALFLLKVFADTDQYSTNQETLIITTSLIKNLFDARRKDEIVIRGILNILPTYVKWAKNLSKSDDMFLNILSVTYVSLRHQNYGPLVHVDFIKCLTKLIHLNPLLKWKINATSETSNIIEILPSYITNPFYIVRLEVVQALNVVFSSEKLDVNLKLNFYEKVINAIAELLIITEINDTWERADEKLSRTATAIHILIGVIRCNVFLQSRALHAIVELSVQNDVKIMLIKRALLSVTKNENERHRLLKVNLYDLLSRWFKTERSLEIFPWALMDCDSQEDFSRKYIDILLAIKLHRLEFREFEILCNNLEISFSQTIEQFFSIIVSLLMSMIVRESSNQDIKSYRLQMWQRIRTNTEQFSQVKKFDVLLQEKLPEIMLDILQRLNDQEHLFAMLDVNFVLPKLNSLNLKAEVVDNCLQYLKMQFRTEESSLIEYLIVRQPSAVQKILLKLFCNVHDAVTVENKILAFHQYCYFYNEIIRKISLREYNHMSFYIIRDFSHSLLIFIANGTSLSKMACSFFIIFLRYALPTRANEIKTILSFAVSKLVTIIKGAKVKTAIDVLRCLIIEHRESLGKAIAKLNEFPNDSVFKTVKRVHLNLKYPAGIFYSLEDEINHFLNANTEETLSCSFESLLQIQNQLSTRKDELYEMYDKLKKLQDFEKNYASNTLHKLIYKLVRMTKSSDTNISLMAAKCLGELGPADLMTMILNTENGYCREDSDEIEMLTLNMIILLADYLVENESNLRKASTDALNAIFSTKCGAYLQEKVNLDARMNSYGIKKPNLHNYIYPFEKEKSIKSLQPITIDEKNWKIFVKQLYDLWIPTSNDSYSKWIIEITCRLLDCFVNYCTEALKPICKLSVKFCEMLLPRLFNLVTKTQESLLNDICVCINHFFECVYELIRSQSKANDLGKTNVPRSYESVKCMINVVNFMRIQTTDCVTLPFDYLLVAKAAQYCSAYCTSIFYTELWCEYILRNPEIKQKRLLETSSVISLICDFKPEREKLLQEIIRESYMNLGDLDSIYGCGLSHLINPSIKTQHYIHLRQWEKVTLALDVALTCGRDVTHDMLNALTQSGHQYLVKCLANKADEKTENVADYMYETAWRLADWSIFERHSATDLQNCEKFGYHAAHYRALYSLHENDITGLEIALKNARTSIVQSLQNTSLECTQTLYLMLSRLQMLQEIEKFATAKQETCNTLFNNYHNQNFIVRHNFQYIEPILLQRIVMLQMQNGTDNITDIDVTVTNTHLKIAEIAKRHGYRPIVYRVIGDLIKKNNLSESVKNQLTYEKAQLDWKEDDSYMGRLVLRNLLKKSSLDDKLRVKALRVYGNWMAKTTCEPSKEIIRKYYNESIEMSSKINDIEALAKAQADLAQFADSRYQQTVGFTEIPEHENLGELKNDAQTRKVWEKSVDVKRAVNIYNRQAAADAQQFEYIKADKDYFLLLAANNYLKALTTGNHHDLLVYRIYELWFENMNHDGFNELFKENLSRVASHKFIALLPQLAMHISNSKTPFAENINDFMQRCAKEHPHHTLPILIALKNVNNDQEFLASTAGSQKHSKTQLEPRIIAVNALISKLSKSDIRKIIQQMCQLYDALTSLAYYKVSEAATKNPGKTHSIPQNQAIMKIRNFDHIMVSTMTLDVRPSGNYNNIAGITEYQANFELLGGINAPKRIICIDSHGYRRKQLLKSKYNVRRDTVLQQLCTTMNTIFKKTEETQRRKLRIRTHNIVPLSRESGVIEWCENSVSISDILCDRGKILGLHTKYNPNDWSVERCKEKLREVHYSSYDTKFATFIECCNNLHPAFQYYFIEKYPSAATWFEKRLAYIRSVATNSMIGYMLGLGGRTPANILLDQATEEVIHIDYGIAFSEKNVLLRSEAVDFRLTRDMEAAMGICGVEGLMKRSCEQTVTVLRENRKILITLLQILVDDPLFASQPDPNDRFSRIHTQFQDSAGKTDKTAEGPLLKIVQKLQGMEDGVISSVSGQVERLINEARDTSKLCRMHYDWQPYL